jgi:basic membrane protein A
MPKKLRLIVSAILLIIITITSVSCAPAPAPETDEETPEEIAAPDGEVSTEEEAAPPSEEKAKVCFIFDVGVDEQGWAMSANKGRLEVEEAFPDVEVVAVDSVPFSEDATRIFEQLIEDGCGMLILTGAYADFALKVVVDHPEVTFLSFGLGDYHDNLRYYIMDIWNPAYLFGMTAGLMTESNKIGYMSGFPGGYSQVDMYVLGAKSVNPDVEAKIVYTLSWSDAVVEQQLANALVDDGIDFIYGDTASLNYLLVLEEREAGWGVSTYADQEEDAPNAYATSMLLEMGPYFVDQVGAYLDGSWEGNGLDIPPFGDMSVLGEWGDSVPDDVRDQVDAMAEKIIDGYNPFVGPIFDTEGNEIIPEGSALTISDLLFAPPWIIDGLLISE